MRNNVQIVKYLSRRVMIRPTPESNKMSPVHQAVVVSTGAEYFWVIVMMANDMIRYSLMGMYRSWGKRCHDRVNLA